jgi:hypothetical protein
VQSHTVSCDFGREELNDRKSKQKDSTSTVDVCDQEVGGRDGVTAVGNLFTGINNIKIVKNALTQFQD